MDYTTYIMSTFDSIISSSQEGIHKMTFLLMLKSEGNLFMEAENFDAALKVYKTAKNWCRKWLIEGYENAENRPS